MDAYWRAANYLSVGQIPEELFDQTGKGRRGRRQPPGRGHGRG
jgi:hypothetical protein